MTQYSVMGGCQQMQMWEIVTKEIGEIVRRIVTDGSYNGGNPKTRLWESRGSSPSKSVK